MNSLEKPLVSIVMCVYNGARFLQQQIESVLSQSFKNFELLILDDNSIDSSEAIIKAYAQADRRIKYIGNDTNLGFNQNFERGFSLASGELIAISDQDDIWLVDKIHQLVGNIGDNILIYSNSSLINEQGNQLEDKLDNRLKHVDDPGYKSFLDGNFVTGHTCLFKRSLLKYLLPFPSHILFYDWWLGFVASYVGKVKYLDVVLTQYRVHTASVMRQNELESRSPQADKAAKYLQLKGFAEAKFLRPADKTFILEFLRRKKEGRNNVFSFMACYIFLYKHHDEIYPWYNKTTLKKLNFLRKQCK